MEMEMEMAPAPSQRKMYAIRIDKGALVYDKPNIFKLKLGRNKVVNVPVVLLLYCQGVNNPLLFFSQEK